MTNLYRAFVRSLLNSFRRPLRWTANFVARYSRHLPALDLGLAWVSFRLVAAYRRFLSPHKGYRCAHAAAGSASCSEVAGSVFALHPFSAAILEIEEQFGRCSRSYLAMQSDLFDQAAQHLPNFENTAEWARVTLAGEQCCPSTPPPPPPPP